MSDWFDPLRHATARSSADAALPPGVQRRALIIEAALGVLAREGLAQLSMRRVALEARVAISLTHYHFESKADLLREVALEHQRRSGAEPVAVAGAVPGDGRWLEAQCRQRLARREALCIDAQFDAAALRSPALAEIAAAGRAARGAALGRAWSQAARGADAGDGDLLDALVDGLTRRCVADESFDLAAACRRAEERLLAGVPAR